MKINQEILDGVYHFFIKDRIDYQKAVDMIANEAKVPVADAKTAFDAYLKKEGVQSRYIKSGGYIIPDGEPNAGQYAVTDEDGNVVGVFPDQDSAKKAGFDSISSNRGGNMKKFFEI